MRQEDLQRERANGVDGRTTEVPAPAKPIEPPATNPFVVPPARQPSPRPVEDRSRTEPPADQPRPEVDEDAPTDLFGADETERFRARWRELQADFVDDPATAVRGADELVGAVLTALTESYTRRRAELDGHRREAGETEELRLALRRYRSLFDQLLTGPSR